MMEKLKKQIIENLKEVYDPEIPINIYDLGLIYEVTVKKNANAHILMSLTSPTCPTAEYIQTMVEDAAKSVEGIGHVEVELTFDPPWTPDRVSLEAKEELGLELPSDDLSLKNTFSPSSESVIEHLCFNCGAGNDKFPILSCFYKGEKTAICTKCLTKFK